MTKRRATRLLACARITSVTSGGVATVAVAPEQLGTELGHRFGVRRSSTVASNITRAVGHRFAGLDLQRRPRIALQIAHLLDLA